MICKNFLKAVSVISGEKILIQSTAVLEAVLDTLEIAFYLILIITLRAIISILEGLSVPFQESV